VTTHSSPRVEALVCHRKENLSCWTGLATEFRQEKEAAQLLVGSVAAEDFSGLVRALARLQHASPGVLANAFRAVGRLSVRSDSFGRNVLKWWLEYGGALRTAMGNDLALLDGLSAMLPRYSGPPKMLYRGETADNRRHRTYGLSWTVDREVARHFAINNLEFSSLGTVILETMAPTKAILCASVGHKCHRTSVEQEFIVDRRRLRSVRVVERLTR